MVVDNRIVSNIKTSYLQILFPSHPVLESEGARGSTRQSFPEAKPFFQKCTSALLLSVACTATLTQAVSVRVGESRSTDEQISSYLIQIS